MELNVDKIEVLSGAASENRPQLANGEDVFVRLSSYKNDRRVNVDQKCLLNGTYTTTFKDYQKCKKIACNPIDRYALPNDEKIKWSFFVKPQICDEYRLGIVQPAHGHNGGGDEALFDNGISANTLFKITPY